MAPHRRGVWFPIVMFLMVAAFVAVVLQRHQIRTWWYLRQLESASGEMERIDLLTRISAELGASERTLLAATRNPSPDIRLLCVPLVSKLDDDEAIPTLDRLLHDNEQAVRESSALMLAFDERDAAWEALQSAAKSRDEGVAIAAVAAISRSFREDMCCPLVQALEGHDSARVRAQAGESLIVTLADMRPSVLSDSRASQAAHWSALQRCAKCGAFKALAAGLSDEGVFEGRLSYEREIEALTAQAAQRGVQFSLPGFPPSSDDRRTVGTFLRDALEHTMGVSQEALTVESGELAETLRSAVETFAMQADDASPSVDPPR